MPPIVTQKIEVVELVKGDISIFWSLLVAYLSRNFLDILNERNIFCTK